MSIFPLPVFEADEDPTQRSALTEAEAIARLRPPKTIVVRFGRMKMVGEYPYRGDATPGCGSKLVARTHRGTELGEMLTTTCENAGCGKSVTRKELRSYIEASGGKEYPFHSDGRILRVATVEDLNAHAALADRGRELVREAKARISELELDMKLVEVECILGGEQITCWYTSEDRVDFRDLVKRLSDAWGTRVLMQQIGARDEARLTADYERCGQYCCCKNFLKVLKPVSMGAAKMQKASLDPLKISGRCGRLMCCLRYEDATYRELRANLPHRKSRVGTSEGAGIVIDTKVLVQLALVKLEHDGREIAVPIEELIDPDEAPKPGEIRSAAAEPDPLRGADPAKLTGRGGAGDEPPERRKKRRRRRGGKGRGADGAASDTDATAGAGAATDRAGGPAADPAAPDEANAPGEGKSKRRRRRRSKASGKGGDREGGDRADGSVAPKASEGDGGPAKKKRRRRGRRRGRGGGGGDTGEAGGGAGGGGGPTGGG